MKTLLTSMLAVIVSATFAQNINTIVGGGYSGLGDGGPALSAELSNCHGLAMNAAGDLYIADTNNDRVRKVSASSGNITTVAGTTIQGYNGDNISAASAQLNAPWDVKLDAAGNLYIADLYNHRVRKIDASTGIITTVAGRPASGQIGTNSGYNGDGIPADSAKLWGPMGIALSPAGDLYIADLYNNRVRKVTFSTGLISTVAGNGSNSYNGDNIAATTAAVSGPVAIAFDASGNLFIAEGDGARVRRVDVSTGMITTVAGNGSNGFSGDGGLATSAQVVPASIAIKGNGDIYMTANNRVRVITNSTGIITTIGGDGNYGYSGDGGPATGAQLKNPSGILLHSSGDIRFSDAINNRVRIISNSVPTSIGSESIVNDPSFFPNPVSSTSYLSFGKTQQQTVITITDVQGKVVRHETFSGEAYQVNKGDLTQGFYILSVKDIKGEVYYRHKIVIE